MKNTKNKQSRYGFYYKSRGKWTGPHEGLTFTKNESKQQWVKCELKWLRKLLKSKVEVRTVKI